jgi:hypothetical protein
MVPSVGEPQADGDDLGRFTEVPQMSFELGQIPRADTDGRDAGAPGVPDQRGDAIRPLKIDNLGYALD